MTALVLNNGCKCSLYSQHIKYVMGCIVFVIPFVVTRSKLNKIKWSQIILSDAQGYFDVKSLAGLTGYTFLGFECRLKEIVFH